MKEGSGWIRLSNVPLVVLAGFVAIATCLGPGRRSVAHGPADFAEIQTSADWKPVEEALGKAGSMQPDDVYKVSLPRSDLKVAISGVLP
jgi:hypothetical protein